MASSIRVKPIDRSNIRTVTIRRNADGSSRIVSRREATEAEKDAVVKKSEEYRRRSNESPIIKAEDKTATVEVNLQAAPPVEEQKTAEVSKSSSSNAVNQIRQQNILYNQFLNSTNQTLNPYANTTNYVNPNAIVPQEIVRFNNIVAQNRGTSQQSNIYDPEAQALYDSIYNPEPIKLKDVKPAKGYYDFTERYLPELAEAKYNEADNVLEKIYGKTVVAAGVGAIRGASALSKFFVKPQEAIPETAKFVGGFATGESQVALGSAFVENPVGTTAEFYTFGKGVELGVKKALYVKDYSRTAGRTKIPFEDLTRPEIVENIGNPNTPRNIKYPYFGETPSKAVELAYSGQYSKNVQQLFGTDKPITFTSSPAPLKGTKVLTKTELREAGLPTSETPIISSVPYVAPTYLKLAESGGSSRIATPLSTIDLFKGKPQITAVISQEVKRPPISFIKESAGSYSKLSDSILRTQKQGETYTAPTFELGKPEIEFGTFAGQQYTPVNPVSGTKFYTTVKGRRIPIDFIELNKDVTGKPISQNKPLSFETIKKGDYDFSRIYSESQARSYASANILNPIIPSSGSSSNVQVKDYIITSGNTPSKSSPFFSITSTTPFNPGKSNVYTEISGSIKVSGSPLPETQFPSSGGSVYDLEPISYPIIPPSPSRTSKPERSRGKSSNVSRSYVPPSIVIPASSSESSTITPPSSIITPSSSIRTPPSRITSTSINTPSSIITPSIFSRTKANTNRGRAYDVLVRRKGIFRKANVQPLTKASAIDFGTYKVGATAAATFKLQPVYGKPTKQPLKGDISNFYRKRGLFIEKREKRIKRTSIGELQEITFKGIKASKTKGKKKKKKGKSIFGEEIKWV